MMDTSDYSYYDPSQPIFGQQYYQRQGSSEDFRQASRYTRPRNRQIVGDYDSGFLSNYKDDTGFREKRLRQYRVNAVNDFGPIQAYQDNYQRLGSSEDFRQTGRGRAGVSTSDVGSIGRRGSRRDNSLTPRERDMRQQQIDWHEMDQDQRYGSRSGREFRKGNRYDARNDRYQERNRGGGWERLSSRDDFRQGAPSSTNSRRQIQRNRNARGGDEYYEDDDDDVYYVDDEGWKRSMNSVRYGYDEYYDPEIIGRNDKRQGNQKRSVWDNIRDVFKF
jgi:hypothetical protein